MTMWIVLDVVVRCVMVGVVFVMFVAGSVVLWDIVAEPPRPTGEREERESGQ